jgi:hypothetical protein
MREPSFQTVKLARGKHSSPRHGACVMELASMLAGERFSDRPSTVSPVIAAFLRGYNDLVDDVRRQDLIRYASEAVGTAATEEVERARVKRLVDWADERWGQRPRPGILGSFGALWARRVPPADPESAGIYAIRSIHQGDRGVHQQVQALLDELIAMSDRPPLGEPASSPACENAPASI